MKKILSFFGILSIIATGSTTVIACANEDNYIYEWIDIRNLKMSVDIDTENLTKKTLEKDIYNKINKINPNSRKAVLDRDYHIVYDGIKIDNDGKFISPGKIIVETKWWTTKFVMGSFKVKIYKTILDSELENVPNFGNIKVLNNSKEKIKSIISKYIDHQNTDEFIQFSEEYSNSRRLIDLSFTDESLFNFSNYNIWKFYLASGERYDGSLELNSYKVNRDLNWVNNLIFHKDVHTKKDIESSINIGFNSLSGWGYRNQKIVQDFHYKIDENLKYDPVNNKPLLGGRYKVTGIDPDGIFLGSFEFKVQTTINLDNIKKIGDMVDKEYDLNEVISKIKAIDPKAKENLDYKINESYKKVPDPMWPNIFRDRLDYLTLLPTSKGVVQFKPFIYKVADKVWLNETEFFVDLGVNGKTYQEIIEDVEKQIQNFSQFSKHAKFKLDFVFFKYLKDNPNWVTDYPLDKIFNEEDRWIITTSRRELEANREFLDGWAYLFLRKF